MHHVMFADRSEQGERHHTRAGLGRKRLTKAKNGDKISAKEENGCRPRRTPGKLTLLTMLLIHTLSEDLRLGVVSSAWNKLAR